MKCVPSWFPGSPRTISTTSVKNYARSAHAEMADFVEELAGLWPKVSLLEPISKSFEEDNEAGKLDKAEEIVGVVLPTNEDPALPLNPGEEALDEPASHVAA